MGMRQRPDEVFPMTTAVSPTLTGSNQEVSVIRAVEPDALAAHDEVFERTI